MLTLKVGAGLETAAGLCSAVATVMTIVQIRDHLTRNPHAGLKVHVNRILLMCPIYAWTSYMGLVVGGEIIWDTARDCYEAFVIYSFVKYMCVVLGGDDAMIQLLQDRPEPQYHIAPVKYFLQPWEMGPEFFHKVQIGVLQYVVIKPLIAIASLLLRLGNVYKEGVISLSAGYFYTVNVNNVSQMWAIYCLVLFYQAFASDLAPIRPLSKLIAIKALVFATFWQSLFVSFMYDFQWIGPPDQMFRLEDAIICIEMVGFAIAHRYVFPPTDYWPDGRDVYSSVSVAQPIFRSLLTAADVSDVFTEIRQGMTGRNRSPTPEVVDMKTTSARVFISNYQPPQMVSIKKHARSDRDSLSPPNRME